MSEPHGRPSVLTDAQCDEFRRLPVSFRDMVRAIYAAGEIAGLNRAAHLARIAARMESPHDDDHIPEAGK